VVTKVSNRLKNNLALTGGTVVTPDRLIEDGLVLAADGLITYVGPAHESEPLTDSTIIEARGKLVLPGLIDTHVHGSHGDDVMLGGAEGIRRISRALLRYGTTSYLPSTISARHDDLLRAIEACVEAEENSEPAAEIVGMHVEGPFINPGKKGAQPRSGIRDPDTAQCLEYLRAAPERIKIMTLAPELPGGIELVRLLDQHGVIASLGHSEADYETALAAIEAGASHATHLYNAMPALHHRKPNLTTACLNEPGIRAEIILDGIHVAPEMARLALKAKGRDGLILVTDAMAAVGCADGNYRLGDSDVRVEGERCTLLDGVTIASSMLTMNRAIGKAIAFMGTSLVDAAYMASLLPATLCGVAHRKGSLEKGKDADIAVLNEDFSVFVTIRGGEVAYRKDA
jgi:N-acetylglucosamine-6-phosphate deacetylase